MNSLCWNCRGLGRSSAVRSLREVLRSHRPEIVGLIETKLSVRRWNRLSVKLGFLNCFAVNRTGLGGGLALLWKEGAIVKIRSFSKWVEGDRGYMLTIFYGNPNKSLRSGSWELLRRLEQGWRGPWIIMGDFNEIMFDWEAVGGACEIVAACGALGKRYLIVG